MIASGMSSLWRRIIVIKPSRASSTSAITFSTASAFIRKENSPGVPGASKSLKSEFGDINIRHLQTVQKYQRAPYHLQTDVRVSAHGKQFLATLEWRWTDPKDGKPNMAVTTGIEARRKWAVAEACRAMLANQNLIYDGVAASSTRGLSEVDRFLQDNEIIKACDAFVQILSDSDSNASPDMVHRVLPLLWRGVVSLHDRRMADSLLQVLESRKIHLPPIVFEELLQAVVYLGNISFGEKLLLSLTHLDGVRLSPPKRALDTDSQPPSFEEIRVWKKWRSLMALEEQACIRSGVLTGNRIIFRRESGNTTYPVVTVAGEAGSLDADNLIMILPPDGSHGLVGIVESMKPQEGAPESITVQIKLLSDEGKRANWVFMDEDLHIVNLAESRINFARINDCLREYYRVGSAPDPTQRFVPSFVGLLRNPGNPSMKTKMKKNSNWSLPPTLALSPSQKKAVELAVPERVSLVHGPPGTGKTHTICGIIAAWRSEDPWKKILACADSNTAADNVFNALKRKGISCFRLSAVSNVLGSPVDEWVLRQIPDKDKVEKYRTWLGYCRREKARKGFVSKASLGPLLGARKQLEDEAIKYFSVIVTTLSSSRHASLNKHLFPRVVVDEAAQAVEPATLMAFSRGCEQAVLVGDHKQLPAVVLSPEAARRGLDKSLFERLVGHTPSVLLNEQRRMHPTISEFSNTTFYDGQICDIGVADRGRTEITDSTSSLFGKSRVVFVDTDACHGVEDTVGTSTRNKGETKIVARVLRSLLDSPVDASSIGVIVPYLAQKAALMKELREQDLLSPDLQINTVEGFQGHEKDYIVISTVRSNAEGFLGFVEDDQRMNVMLTRARHGLVVVGDRKTLEKRNNSRWKQWIQWCAGKGDIVSVQDLEERNVA